MKKGILYLTSALLLIQPGLEAQQTGSAAASSSSSAKSSNWQNWVFAGSALIMAAIGITVVAINSGKDAHGH